MITTSDSHWPHSMSQALQSMSQQPFLVSLDNVSRVKVCIHFLKKNRTKVSEFMRLNCKTVVTVGAFMCRVPEKLGH